MNGKNRTRRRIRVKSRCRFVAFLVIVAGLMITGLGFATGMNESTASVITDYETYVVGSGDTLWSIAEDINQSDLDTRKVIYVIRQMNDDIQPEDLRPGMELTVPATI